MDKSVMDKAIIECMRNDPDVLATIKDSMKAIKEGRFVLWNDLKKELGL